MIAYRTARINNESVLINLRNQRETGQFCDIHLITGEHHSSIHSAVVCPISFYLNKKHGESFKSSLINKNNEMPTRVTIHFTGIVSKDCIECLEKILDLMYAKTVHVDVDHVAHFQEYYEVFEINDTLDAVDNNREPFNDDGDTSNDAFYLNNEKYFHVGSISDETLKCDDQDNTLSGKFGTPNKTNDIQRKYFKLPLSKILKCMYCDFKCNNSLNLLKHLLQAEHDGKACSLCWMTFDTSSMLKEHYVLHQNSKLFFCELCGTRFQTRTLLVQHLPTHMVERPFSCDKCNKTFKSKHSLNRHLVLHDYKMHLCDECGFSTLHSQMLQAHKRLHSGDLFKCPIDDCSHTSAIKQNMQQHIATHDNKKLFICELCGHKFSQSWGLKRHSLIHDEREGGKICPHCPFKTQRADNLKAHIFRLHTVKKSKSNDNETLIPNTDDSSNNSNNG